MRVRHFSALLFLMASAALYSQASPNLPDWVEMHANIQYSTYGATKLDIMIPTNAKPGSRPGVIVIHGGGWTGGTKESQVVPICLRYLEKGFVVANVEYRLAKDALAPAAVEDAMKAADWVFKNASKYNIDKKRIVVTGGSAGGHLALMVGMTPASANLGKPLKVRAVINFYGITDVADQLSGPNMRKYAATWLPERPDRPDIAKRVSPKTYVRKNLPPILTLHGDADQTVPYQHGVNLTGALKQAGAQAELITVPNGRHGFPPEKLDELYPKIFDFLKKNGVMTE